MSARQHHQKTTNQTELLISLVDFSELAVLSNTGYPKFIDIKNPSRGSLGFPKMETVRKIAENLPDSVLLSVAIGDADCNPTLYAKRAVNALQAGADIIKIGLFDVPASKVLSFLEELKKLIVKEAQNVLLVAGLYADRSSGEELSAFPKIVADAGWYGCLIDTYEKNGKRLPDFVEMKILARFVKSCREVGVASIIAGSLSLEDKNWINNLSPTVAGFRGAVVKGKRGEIGLSQENVGKLLKTSIAMPVIT